MVPVSYWRGWNTAAASVLLWPLLIGTAGINSCIKRSDYPQLCVNVHGQRKIKAVKPMLSCMFNLTFNSFALEIAVQGLFFKLLLSIQN